MGSRPGNNFGNGERVRQLTVASCLPSLELLVVHLKGKNGTIRAFTRAKIKSISAKVCFEQSTIYASLHCEGSFSCSDRRVETI